MRMLVSVMVKRKRKVRYKEWNGSVVILNKVIRVISVIKKMKWVNGLVIRCLKCELGEKVVCFLL